jgi:hypothetical protein
MLRCAWKHRPFRRALAALFERMGTLYTAAMGALTLETSSRYVPIPQD